jgi:1-acyl-sn-glycerol-3-phosphate acyltransferase
VESQPSSTSRATGQPQRVAAFWDGVKGRFGPMLRWLWGFEIHDAERLPDGPVIIVSNHVSNVDPVLVGFALNRPGAFMAKQELFRIPGVHWFITKAGAFPVQRGQGDSGAMATADQILSEGWPLIIYPEGTRNDSGKWGTMRLRSGVARIALTHRVPIVPIVCVNTHTILPKGAWWPRRVKAKAYVGEPLLPADYLPPDGLAPDEQVRYINERIFWAVAALLPDSMKVEPVPAGTAPGC